MTLTKSEQRELNLIKRVVKGTPVKVKRVGPANVTISGVGTPITKQLGDRLGAYTVALAKAKVWAKRQK